MDPNMGTRVLKLIPNTPALVAWGLKPTTGKLSDYTKTAAQEEPKFLGETKKEIALL